MLIIRGANIYPSAVETVLRQCEGLGAEFQMVVDKRGTMDEMTVRVELTPDAARGAAELSAEAGEDTRERIRKDAEAQLSRSMQIRIPVELLEPGTLEPTIFKARRVVDRRQDTQAAATT
jgi:phenylacetate-CoA ligase